MNKKHDITALIDDEVLMKVFDDADALKDSSLSGSLNDSLRTISERYKLHECVGEGMIKKVYRAHDYLMDREVAFATLRSDDPELREELIREIRLTASLEHANISPVYDMGFDSDGLPFFVTKLYSNRDLHLLLRLDSLPINLETRILWILSVFSKICEAVAFAHSRGILHFDIKPSNIQVSDYGEVRLCDWGIARQTRSKFKIDEFEIVPQIDSGLSRATLYGEVRGTPGYMAPEQLECTVDCDEQADVFGLGALLFTMIKGVSPVNNKNLDSVDFPVELKAICYKALADSKADRYQSVDALISDLDKYQNGLVTIAEKAGLAGYLSKWVRRHKKIVTVCVANLLLLIGSLSGYMYSIKKSEQKQTALATTLKLERDFKDKEQLRHAATYYEQAKKAASAAWLPTEFDIRDVFIAHSLVVRALELNPALSKAAGLQGELQVMMGLYQEAEDSFVQGDNEFTEHLKMIREYNALSSPEDSELTLKLRLVSLLYRYDLRLLKNVIIIKFCNEVYRTEAEIPFFIDVMKTVHGKKKFHYRYRKETEMLDLSKTIFKTRSPIRTLNVKRLILRKTNWRDKDMHNLNALMLELCDLSETQITTLQGLTNLKIKELNISNNAIMDLSALKSLRIRRLTINDTSNDPEVLSVLAECPSLREICCSQIQADILRPIINESILLSIK